VSKRNVTDVRVSRRILWVGAEAYPLVRVARVRTVGLAPKRGPAVRRLIAAIRFWIALPVSLGRSGRMMSLVRRCVPALALLVIIVTTGAGVPNRTLTLDPTSGPPGAKVTAAGELGADCVNAQSVSVRLDGAVIASRVTFTIPVQTPPGRHSVSVVCNFTDGVDSDTLRGKASFTVQPPVTNSPTPQPTPTTEVSVPPASNEVPAGPDPFRPDVAGPGPAGPGPVNPGPVNPDPIDRVADPSRWLAGLISLALVGLAVLIWHLARSRSGRSGLAAAGISVVPVPGPISSPTLQSSQETTGVDIQVVLRPDPGEPTLWDR
jgi:hypothetical protein